MFTGAKPDEITGTQVTTLLSPSIYSFVSCLSCHHHAEVVFPSILRPSMCLSFQTLLYDSSTVGVLSNLQQDLLHISVLPRRINKLCDPLLQCPGQRHKLYELALWAFVNLQEHKPDNINRDRNSGLNMSSSTYRYIIMS